MGNKVDESKSNTMLVFLESKVQNLRIMMFDFKKRLHKTFEDLHVDGTPYIAEDEIKAEWSDSRINNLAIHMQELKDIVIKYNRILDKINEHIGKK